MPVKGKTHDETQIDRTRRVRSYLNGHPMVLQLLQKIPQLVCEFRIRIRHALNPTPRIAGVDQQKQMAPVVVRRRGQPQPEEIGELEPFGASSHLPIAGIYFSVA